MRSGGVACVLLLTVCLSVQRTSTQRCLHYLTIEKWVEDIFEPQWNLTKELRQMFPTLGSTKHMNKTIVLVLANNTEDVAKCTAKRLCERNRSTCYLLRDCFNLTSTAPGLSDQCQTKQFAIVHTFHFMCLVARAASLHTHVLGCEHEHVCPVIRNKDNAEIPKPAMVVAMTTKGGSSAATPTTTGATTTCAATAGATTTSATTLQQSLAPSQQGKALEISHTCSSPDIATYQVLLAVSCSLMFLLPLMVYIVMSRQRKQPEDRATVRTSDCRFPPVVLHIQKSPETFDVPRPEAEALMNNNSHFHCVMNSEDLSSSSTDMPCGGGADAPQEEGV